MNRKTSLLLVGASLIALMVPAADAGMAPADAPALASPGIRPVAAPLPDPLSPSALARANCAPGQGSSALLRRLASHQAETKPFRAAEEGTDLKASSVPMFKKLGAVKLDAKTVAAEARPWLEQGLRFAYAFNHQAAAASFRRAQALDPGCALCFWGEALVLGPNINAPMGPGDNEAALAALARAKALLPSASAKERALVEALDRRYSADPKAQRPALDAAYADAMAKVAATYPDDPEIAVLTAEAMMDAQPWDYWEAAGTKPKGRTAEILALLDRALGLLPEHAGALHYSIHMLEASATPHKAEPLADRLAALDLEAGHLVHMPSHLYLRIGRYRDSIDVNLKAVEADEAMLASMPQTGLYPGAYYPHNIHFAMTAAQMAGDGQVVLSMAEKLARVVTPETVRVAAWVQPIMAAPFFAHVQYSSPDRVLQMPEPEGDLPFVHGLWRYARGVALAQSGRAEEAGKELAAIRATAEKPALVDLAAAGIPAADVMRIAAEVLEARLAQARKDHKGAIAHLRKAAELEATLSYTEPPHWYFPVNQSLGAQLLLAGQVDEAEQAFRRSLAQAPNDGRAIYGLMEVAKARKDKAAQAAAEADLARAWAGDRALLSLDRL